MTTTIALAKKVIATEQYLVIEMEDGVFQVEWSACSSRLAVATTEQRNCLRLSPSGYGINWPLIDEDLAIVPLLAQAVKESQHPVE